MEKPLDFYFGELKIHSQYLDEALLSIIHTILYIRAPETVTPKDQLCEQLNPLIYNTVGVAEVDNTVR